MKETNVINSTGIILLTGGKSSRMHNDKMSLPWKENDTFLSALIKTSKHMGFGGNIDFSTIKYGLIRAKSYY